MQFNSSDWPDLVNALNLKISGAERLHSKVKSFLAAREGQRLLVAVSGGADSVFLLCLLWPEARRLGIDLVVAHYNHGWRGADSDEDAAFVAALAEGLGVSFELGCADDETVVFSETAARESRLAFLRESALRRGCVGIAFGHQQNDIAETQLMRLARGSGTEGLAAPRPVHPFPQAPTHLRPLLNLSASFIRSAMESCALPWREDSSNKEIKITRNGLRHRVLPALQETLDHDFFSGAARSRRLLEEDAEALQALAKARFPDAFSGEERLDRQALREAPIALLRRALHAWLQIHGLIGSTSAASMELLIEAVCGEKRSCRQSVGEAFIVLDRDTLFLELSNPSDGWMEPLKLAPGGRLVLPDGALISMDPVTVDRALQQELSAGQIDPLVTAYLEVQENTVLTVRSWLPGDRFHPLGAPGSKKLKDWFIDRHVPVMERKRRPVVITESGEIVWVPGFPPAEALKIRAASKQALRLTYRSAQSLFKKDV